MQVRLDVILLCGLPGSGKSTLARRILSIDPTIISVNQDELGDRRACENLILNHLAHQSLSTNDSGDDAHASTVTVLVDRCNFDQRQRQTWISMAHAFHGRAAAITLQVPIAVCADRIRTRENHPQAVHVCSDIYLYLANAEYLIYHFY
jgi:predicted kinase